MGSVALSVIRGAGRPVLLYRPGATPPSDIIDAEEKIASVVATLDGYKFSEAILPFAAEMAKSLKARLELIQVLPGQEQEPGVPGVLTTDVLESSYLHRQASEIRRKFGLQVDWDVLHGNPADAIYNYLQGRHEVMLAMTSHARQGLGRTIFGSVSSECVRRAGIPVLLDLLE